MKLREDEEKYVILEEHLEKLANDEEFIVLGTVHTTRTFKHGEFFGAMRLMACKCLGFTCNLFELRVSIPQGA